MGKRKNYRVPKDKDPAALTLEECYEIARNSGNKKGKGGSKGSSTKGSTSKGSTNKGGTSKRGTTKGGSNKGSGKGGSKK